MTHDDTPHVIRVRVYFADLAKTMDVDWVPATARVLHTLSCTDSVYYAATRTAQAALRPFATEI